MIKLRNHFEGLFIVDTALSNRMVQLRDTSSEMVLPQSKYN